LSDYTVKKYLSIQDRVSFVDNVVALCQLNDDYEPALFEFAWNYCLVKYFTDFELPDEQDKVNDLFYTTNILADIYDKSIDITSLRSAVDEKIKENFEFRKLAIQMAKPDPFDRIADSIDRFFNDIEPTIKDVDKGTLDLVLKKLNGMSKKKIIDSVVRSNHSEQDKKLKVNNSATSNRA
jgi:hypothetical protein